MALTDEEKARLFELRKRSKQGEKLADFELKLLMDAWPDKGPSIVKAAMLRGQQRHVDGECQHCNATGLIAEKAA